MQRKSVVVLVFLSAVALSSGQQQNIPAQPSSSIPPTSSSTTTTTTTTSPTPSTTSATTSTSTSSPSPPPSSSTSAPTTPKPTPRPPPEVGNYTVKDGNETCIIAQFAVEVVILFKNYTWEWNLPSSMSVNSSSCGNSSSEELVLESSNATLSFLFVNKTERFLVQNITLTFKKDGTYFNFISNETEFTAPLKKSYRCEKVQEIKLIDQLNISVNSTTTATVKISHLQLQAFHNGNGDNFGAAEDCESAKSPDIVPIAVGCALVGLIAIVLIAYLVGRRRSQARGYLSM